MPAKSAARKRRRGRPALAASVAAARKLQFSKTHPNTAGRQGCGQPLPPADLEERIARLQRRVELGLALFPTLRVDRRK